MATVFAFLGLLVVAIGAAGRVIAPLERFEASDDPLSLAGSDGATQDEELAVAIAAAMVFARARRGGANRAVEEE